RPARTTCSTAALPPPDRSRRQHERVAACPGRVACRLILHRAALDLQQVVEPRGRHRRLHFLLDVALADEGIDPALREAFVGLAHGVDHGGEGGAGGGGEPEAERREIALLERKLGKAVGAPRMRISSAVRVNTKIMSAPARLKASPRRSASSSPESRRALVRATMTKSGSVRAATAALTFSTMDSVGTRCSTPT